MPSLPEKKFETAGIDGRWAEGNKPRKKSGPMFAFAHP
jgi:hypothetical protein